jgi:tRNA (cmo5U34)-methyltransferase
MGVRETFDRFARSYDRSRRQLVPGFDAFYGTALGRLPFDREDDVRLLDLGAGTGLLSALIADAFPRARIELVDISDAMLARARERFDGESRFRFRRLDYLEEPLEGPYDAVVSALSIHHATHSAKAELFREVARALVPGGVFVNADQVLGDLDSWLCEVRESGVSERDLASARERMREDRPSTVEDQLRWLEAAGFRDVDCWYRSHIFAVFGGSR